MSEPTAEYIAMIDHAERMAQRAGASIEHERLEVDAAVGELLGKIADMNCPARGEHFWRCVVQRAYERLGEVVQRGDEIR